MKEGEGKDTLRSPFSSGLPTLAAWPPRKRLTSHLQRDPVLFQNSLSCKPWSDAVHPHIAPGLQGPGLLCLSGLYRGWSRWPNIRRPLRRGHG